MIPELLPPDGKRMGKTPPVLFLVLSFWPWDHTAIKGQARSVSDYGSSPQMVMDDQLGGNHLSSEINLKHFCPVS